MKTLRPVRDLLKWLVEAEEALEVEEAVVPLKKRAALAENQVLWADHALGWAQDDLAAAAPTI